MDSLEHTKPFKWHFIFHGVSLRSMNYLQVSKDIGELTMLWQLLHYQHKMVQFGWGLRVLITRFIGDGVCRPLMDNGLVSPPLNENRNCWYWFLPSMHSFINYSSMYGKSTQLFLEHISRDSLQSPATVKKHDGSQKYSLQGRTNGRGWQPFWHKVPLVFFFVNHWDTWSLPLIMRFWVSVIEFWRLNFKFWESMKCFFF